MYGISCESANKTVQTTVTVTKPSTIPTNPHPLISPNIEMKEFVVRLMERVSSSYEISFCNETTDKNKRKVDFSLLWVLSDHLLVYSLSPDLLQSINSAKSSLFSLSQISDTNISDSFEDLSNAVIYFSREVCGLFPPDRALIDASNRIAEPILHYLRSVLDAEENIVSIINQALDTRVKQSNPFFFFFSSN